ncbi:MAG: hypothetical protein U0T81_12945 [Saprospiraceae bacterium]
MTTKKLQMRYCKAKAESYPLFDKNHCTKEDPSTEADLKEYLTSLSQRIFETYNIQGDKIKLFLDLQNINGCRRFDSPWA